MNTTGIEWADYTWNPTTGCDRVSPGCDNCYALAQAGRLKRMKALGYQNDGDPKTSGPGFKLTIQKNRLDDPRKVQQRSVVFVNSMSDLFHMDVPVEYIRDVFDVCRETPQHAYLVLTKRHNRMARLAPKLDWPPNVGMGVSVENPAWAHRIDYLRRVPAALRFVSAEPLLEGIPGLDLSGIGWVIVGGESGPNARPVKRDWVADIREQCHTANVPFFFKQWGGVTAKAGGRELDGEERLGTPLWWTPRAMCKKRTLDPVNCVTRQQHETLCGSNMEVGLKAAKQRNG